MIIRLSISPDTLDHISFVEVVCSDQDKADVIKAVQNLGRRVIYNRFDSRWDHSKTLHFKIEQVGSILYPDSVLDVENFKSLVDSSGALTSQALNHASAGTPEGRVALRRQFLIIDGELVKFATVRVERTPDPNNILYQCWEDDDAMVLLADLPPSVEA